MNLLTFNAVLTAVAATVLVCTTAFTSLVAMDLALTGLLHLPRMVTLAIGALIAGSDGWLGVWLFRQAYAVEQQLASAPEQAGI